MKDNTRSKWIIRIIAAMFPLLWSELGFSQPTSASPQNTSHQYWAFIGNGSDDGIALFKLDAEAGTLTPSGIAAAAKSPGFLAISPDQKILFAAVAGDLPGTGNIEGFSIDASSGKLTPINQQSSEGSGAAFVSVDPSGRDVLAANYSSATVCVLPIDASGKLSSASCVIKETGSSVDPDRQTHAYAHSINCDPTGKFAITCDLGADKIFIYKLDAAAGKLAPSEEPFVTVPRGSGPRHLTFSPDGKFAYVVNEMGATVIVFSWDSEKGILTQIQVVKTLKNDEKGNTSAEVQIDPSGKFLYASNRLSTNYLTVFLVDARSGMLTLEGYQDSMGKTPRNFRIDPSGKYLLLANQNSDTLVFFSIDAQTGQLTPIGKPIPTLHGPMCVKFVAVEKTQ